MLKGRLGLETARVPQGDRHGLLWLSRGRLYVEDGSLRFRTKGGGDLECGDYSIPFQMLSCILLGPGSTVSQDSLRLLARHGTGLVATADDGVRMYASMPFGRASSKRFRNHVRLWSDAKSKNLVARRMYAWRLGEVLPSSDLNVLRGLEGSRVKASYRHLADLHGVVWHGRRYDRKDPMAADLPNQAINHAAVAVRAGAALAVAVSGTAPELGFIHEDSSLAFALDIADLYREAVTVPVAFGCARDVEAREHENLERLVRKRIGAELRKGRLVVKMIDRIKELIDANDRAGDDASS